MNSKSRCLWLFSENCSQATYSYIPVAEVSCVCSDKAWCPLATVDVGANHPNLHQIPISLWNGNYQILPGIPILSIDSPLPNAGYLRNLWSYVCCKGVQMTTVADHLDDAGFNSIAKSSLLELMYIINQEKTRLQMDIAVAMLPLSLYRIILPYLCFLWLYLNVCIVCNDCTAV